MWLAVAEEPVSILFLFNLILIFNSHVWLMATLLNRAKLHSKQMVAILFSS